MGSLWQSSWLINRQAHLQFLKLQPAAVCSLEMPPYCTLTSEMRTREALKAVVLLDPHLPMPCSCDVSVQSRLLLYTP